MAKRPRNGSPRPAKTAERAEGDRDRPRPETPTRPKSLEDEIRLRAYYRYLEREGEPGDEMSDWLDAESDVLGRRATGVDAEEKVSDDGR